MNSSTIRAIAFATALFSVPAGVFAAGTPPAPAPLPTPHLPSKPLHVQLQVEVNKRGQVVRVVHGTLSPDSSFNTMTLGNAMQMWIRHPDGTAETGLYRVSYDYDPHTKNVKRTPELLKSGGNWADKPGAATQIMQDARREVEAVEARLRADERQRQQQEAKHLPDINAAVKRAMASPTHSPRP